jgi:hypothetical protein
LQRCRNRLTSQIATKIAVMLIAEPFKLFADLKFMKLKQNGAEFKYKA